MNSFLKFFIAIICLVSTASCWKNDLTEYFGRHGMMTPAPYRLEGIPQGDDSYSQGFRDGCNTAMSVIGSGMLNSMYEDSYIDANRVVEDENYNQGKTLGFNYCTYHLDVDPL